LKTRTDLCFDYHVKAYLLICLLEANNAGGASETRLLHWNAKKFKPAQLNEVLVFGFVAGPC